MVKKLMISTFSAAIVLSPVVASAGGPGDGGVADQIVVAPQDTDDAPVVGSLNGSLIAGAALLALVALASSGDSTSGTNGTN